MTPRALCPLLQGGPDRGQNDFPAAANAHDLDELILTRGRDRQLRLRTADPASVEGARGLRYS